MSITPTMALIIIVGVAIFFYYLPLGLWLSARASGLRLNLLKMAGIRIRKVPLSVIVNAKIIAHKAGLDLSMDDLEAHYLMGGNIEAVVNVLISADKENMPLDFKAAAELDLKGRL